MTVEKKDAVAKKGAFDLANLGQDDIPGMLKVVNAKIDALRKGIPSTPKTTGNLPGFGRIADITTVEELVKAHSSVIGRAKAYRASAKTLVPKEIKTPLFTLGGSTEKEWVDDIKSKVIVVAHKEELEKLDKVKAKLEDNLSSKAKLAKDLQEIGTILMDE